MHRVQSYNPEIRDALIDKLLELQYVVGYHFVWCEAYLESTPTKCTCGMDLMRQAKAKLSQERFDEYDLWMDALGE